MIYVYAITDRPPGDALPGPGIGGSRLLACTNEGVSAVISPLTCAEVAPTAENVWRHEEIVERLMADSVVLPVRFGTVLADEAEVQAMLAARYSRFVTDLDRVRGRVELGLRVLWEDEDARTESKEVGTARSGRAYLLARLEEERQARACRERGEALAVELDRLLVGLAVAREYQVSVNPRLSLMAAYLVERGAVEDLRGQMQTLGATHPELHFVCTGPWPPYSFVSAGPSEVEERERWDMTQGH